MVYIDRDYLEGITEQQVAPRKPLTDAQILATLRGMKAASSSSGPSKMARVAPSGSEEEIMAKIATMLERMSLRPSHLSGSAGRTGRTMEDCGGYSEFIQFNDEF